MNALELATALETGPDCTCHAAGYFECCCDTAVWPEQWLPHAAAELRRLHAVLTSIAAGGTEEFTSAEEEAQAALGAHREAAA